MANDVKHFGVLGMHWGVRREKVLKPTYQYRDSQGNLVSMYGKGPYGGGPKPTHDPKGDKKFMREVNKMAKTIDADTPVSQLKKPKSTSSVTKQTIGMLAAVGVVYGLKIAAMHAINKAAYNSMVAKYGKDVADILSKYPNR